MEKKLEKMIISHIDECKWEQREEHGNFRWKYLADSTKFNSHGLSCGVLVLPYGEELELHHHVPQEIYLIRKGEGLLLRQEGEPQYIREDSFVYIPKNCLHGLRNIGKEDLEILWIFPTDCWEEVEYIFAKD